MVLLKNGRESFDHRFDRIPSETTEHLEKYPLTRSTMPSSPSSMELGVNWYSNFDNPRLVTIRGVKRWVIGEGSLGQVLGGHAICARHWLLKDLKSWWRYYNQGQEGRCVEFAKLRLMSQLNRTRYDITSRFHYHTDQHRDEWVGCYLGHDGFRYEGTSVRAGLEGLRVDGAIPAKWFGRPISAEEAPSRIRLQDGISEYRWAKSLDDVRTALGVPSYLPGIPINNSWGTDYPHEVILLNEAAERLLREDGEFGIVTDR